MDSKMTQKDLLDFLTERGFKKCRDAWSNSDNTCGWYAAKQYTADSRCETNDSKLGIQIVVWPYELYYPQLEQSSKSMQVEITGEANGIWYKLCAYSISWDEAIERFDELTESLVVAWDSIPREEINETL